MTRKEAARLAASIRRVADTNNASAHAIRAIVRAISEEFEECSAGWRFEATGIIDLSGRDYVKELSA